MEPVCSCIDDFLELWRLMVKEGREGGGGFGAKRRGDWDGGLEEGDTGGEVDGRLD